ncbi:hypothetical protein [Nocardioides stalactiti]|uniref:hypothetical protein n=1 Tax=Nocardioides stalactiti TaxID=2755356 RepID=UPI0016010982|nr:hypothetical protein [Nocardioides stalactiti]
MVDDFEIRSEDVENLVRKIRTHADAKGLRRELFRGLNSVTKDIRGQMIEVIPAALPRRGGLAEQVAGATRASTSAKAGRYAGVSMRFSARGHDLRTLTGKRLRHPLFGHRGHWFDQTAGVEPAVFTGEFDKQLPDVQRAIRGVLEDIAREVTNI